jgi:hypothetical protein
MKYILILAGVQAKLPHAMSLMSYDNGPEQLVTHCQLILRVLPLVRVSPLFGEIKLSVGETLGGGGGGGGVVVTVNGTVLLVPLTLATETGYTPAANEDGTVKRIVPDGALRLFTVTPPILTVLPVDVNPVPCKVTCNSTGPDEGDSALKVGIIEGGGIIVTVATSPTILSTLTDGLLVPSVYTLPTTSGTTS